MPAAGQAAGGQQLGGDGGGQGAAVLARAGAEGAGHAIGEPRADAATSYTLRLCLEPTRRRRRRTGADGYSEKGDTIPTCSLTSTPAWPRHPPALIGVRRGTLDGHGKAGSKAVETRTQRQAGLARTALGIT
jgi:hypothetical protein